MPSAGAWFSRNSMQKVAIISDDFPPYVRGGAGIVAGSEARELVKRGYDVTIITSVQDPALQGSFIENGMRIERLHVRSYHPRWRAYKSIHNRGVIQQIRRLFTEIQPDIVHAHNVHEYLSYGVFKVGRAVGARVFLTAHDAMLVHYGKLLEPKRISWTKQLMEYRFWYNPVRNFLIRKQIESIDKIFAVSHALGTALKANGIKDLQVLHNGIDPDEWRCEQNHIDDFIQTHALQGKKIILFGGRISGMKGGDVMLQALPNILSKVPNTILLIAGKENEYIKSLRNRAERMGIGEAVCVTGWLTHKQMSEAYHAASMVAVPSVYLDPLPTVVLEAMACAKPVAGSTFGGIPEMIENNATGIVVDPRNTTEWSAATALVLSDQDLAGRMGRASLERVREAFSIEKHMEALIFEYENVQ